MKLSQHIATLFEISEGHTAKVVICGGTDLKTFQPSMQRMLPEELLKEMDENTSRLGLSLHPVLATLMQGTDGHVHVNMALPLQKWSADMVIEPSVLESKGLSRITDWVAGFMEVFCMNDSISAYDLETEQMMIGSKNGVYNLPDIIKDIVPKRELPAMDSAGSVEEILGQMSNEEIEAVTEEGANKAAYIEKTEAVVERIIKSKDINEQDKEMVLKKTQQAVMKKYGYAALVELATKMGQPLLVKEPKV